MGSGDTFRIILKPGREKSLVRRHPWIFSGAIAEEKGAPPMGETVGVYSSDGTFLAWAAYSPHSQIRARAWSFRREDVVGREFFRKRISDSVARRKALGMIPGPDSACRLVFSESDGLPGLIADMYGGAVVMQCLTAGAERHKAALAELIAEASGGAAVLERSDAAARGLEGLPASVGLLIGDKAPECSTITENGLKFIVELSGGQKTGFYLDQRDNRKLLRDAAADRRVLDCFCYTGGFAVNALAGGAASVTAVDSSESALALLPENAALNGLGADSVEVIAGDVFQVLRNFVGEKKKFDLIVLDPPKYAPSRSQVEKAERAYKDINMLALKLLDAGGLLFTFSCSGAIGPENFQRIAAWAAKDAGVDARVIRRMSQSPDHPVALSFPESEYLKGLVLQV